MESLFLEGQKHTPEVRLDPSQGEFCIIGRSYPENASKFYDPIKAWFLAYDHESPYVINFRFDYLSSSSVVAILAMLRELEANSKPGKEIKIRWIYDEEDDDLKRTGEDIMRFLNLEIELEAVIPE